jgi:hypothetical protein
MNQTRTNKKGLLGRETDGSIINSGRPIGIINALSARSIYGPPQRIPKGARTTITTIGYPTTMVVLIIRDLSMGFMLR